LIVRENKRYETLGLYPDSDWYTEGNYVVNETTENGKLIASKIIEHCPYFDFVLDGNGNLIDIAPTERSPEPPSEPTQDDYMLDLDFRLSMIELGI